MSTLRVRWLGRVSYADADALQRGLHEHGSDDHLLVLEHPHVYTLGTTSHVEHVLTPPANVGAELVRTDRGGDVTYHGPGQLVAYPIIALSRRGLLLRPLVRALEAAMVATSEAFGVAAARRDGHPGCWCDPDGPSPRKLGALGIRVERGVSYHGIALNIDPDLADFDLIDPCGMPGVESTSIARELARRGGEATAPSVEAAAGVFARALAVSLHRSG
jgi:lipoic acid synthetase